MWLLRYMSFKNSRGFTPIILILGVLLLAGAVGLYYYLNQKSPTTVNTQPKKQAPLSISLESPSDGVLVNNGRLLVKGKTLPKTTVVFYTDSDSNSLESNNLGSFQGDINLTKGINTLTITAYGENGEEVSTTLDIVYDPQS